jgi:CheY-like chemotaxis protein
MAILIVEDNPVSARLVEQTLKRYDFETFTASNGVAALEILSKNPASIDIVITDLMMPEMDGLALAKKIKTSPEYEHIPVIVCTVLRDAENIKKAAAIGCRHYLLKPYRPEELRAKVLECRRHEMKVMRSKAEIMSNFHLKEDQYDEIRASFRQLLESYISFKDEKTKSNNNGDFDLVNIHECAVTFGTERLKILLERHEKGERDKINDSALNQALLSEMSNVVKALSK